ncbi:MAG: MFS transporter [Phocaeicola sp.]
MVINFALLTLSMFFIAVSPDIRFILFASLVTGICSVMPQVFIPVVSQFSKPENKARNVGILVSGLLTGILGSRVISGIIGEYWGWRTMYYVASCFMAACAFIVDGNFARYAIQLSGKTYRGLMKSLFSLYVNNPAIRIISLRAGFCFGSFLALWACLAFKLSGPPFYTGNNLIGMLGLCGIAGALTASFVGSSVRRLGARKLTYIGCVLMIIAWIGMLLFQYTYISFIIGIVIIDIGMQCVQISNQTRVLSLVPQASSRANTILQDSPLL